MSLSSFECPTRLSTYTSNISLLLIVGENFLIPTNGRLASIPALAKSTFISLDLLIETVANVRPKGSPIVCILDCCRIEAEKDPTSACNDLVKGGETQSNVFIMYATSKKSIADEGEEGGNGAFTGRLLEYMNTDMTIDEISRAIVNDLRKDSEGKQVCAMYKSACFWGN